MKIDVQITAEPGNYGWECKTCPPDHDGPRGADGFSEFAGAHQGMHDHLIEDHGVQVCLRCHVRASEDPASGWCHNCLWGNEDRRDDD